MERKHIFLTKDEVKKINQIAKAKQIRSSELIRRIIDEFIEKEEQKDGKKMDKK